MLELESPPAPPGGPSSTFVWKYCRMCALEVRQGVYIFGEEGRRLQLPEKIRKTTAILVLEEDSLPKKICTTCCTRLESYAQFKDAVVDAQEKLSSIARSIEKSQEQSLLQLRNQNLLRSPKRLRLYSSAPVGSQSSSHVLLPAPSMAAAADEPDMDDPAMGCDDEPDPPNSSEGEDENETPKCTAPVEAAGREREDEGISQEPSQGPSQPQPLPVSTKQATHGQLHPDSVDTSKNSSSSNNSPATSSDGEVEGHLELEAYLICGLCTAHLTDKNSLLPHHNRHHHNEQEEPMFGCSVCPRITPHYEAIRQHIYRHRMDGTFSCADCDKSYPTKDQLHVHISSKHNPAGDKPFSCGTCGKRYGTNIALTAHQRKKHKLSHHDEYSDTPGSTNQNDRNMTRTVNLSIVESPPRITSSWNRANTPASSSENLCKTVSPRDKEYSSTSGGQEETPNVGVVAVGANTGSSGAHTQSNQQPKEPHQSTSSSNDKTQSRQEEAEGHWKCPNCDKILLSKSGYDTHIKTHRGKRYSCDYCGASYTQKTTLDHHIKVHHTNVDKEFECPECKKQFKTCRQLAGHHKIHEKPFSNVSCPQCEKKFSNMVSLKTHMKFHRGSKRFTCADCPKAFFTKLALQEHMNSHTGRRPFGCPAENCSKIFSCSSNYAKHFKKNHSELVGPKGSMVPPAKMLEDNNNIQATMKSPVKASNSDTLNHTMQSSNSKSCSTSTGTVLLQPVEGQQSLSRPSPNPVRLLDFSQQACPPTQPLLTESPAHGHPTTVIQVPFPANLSIPQKSISQLTSSASGSYSNGVQTSSVSSIQNQPPSSVYSSPTTSSILQVTSHPNLTYVGSNSTSGHGHGAQSHVIALHSSNLSSTENNISLAHSQSSIPSGSGGLSQAHSHHPVNFHVVQTAHMNPPSTNSTHTQTVGVQSHHPITQLQLQPHTQSVWQPVMLPSSKTYNHPNTTAGLATINGLDLLDCAGVIVAAHSSESLPTSSSNNHSHSQHQQSNFNVIHMPVTAAHNSTMSHSTTSHFHHHGGNGNSGHSNGGSISHHSHHGSSSLHIPHPTPSAHNSIPLSNAGTVTVPNFVPSSQQNEPMELSYKLDSNNFQDMPMELTKVFQRDPLELCVRQDFGGAAQPLMDLSSRVVNVSDGGNSSINVSSMSMNLNGNTSSSQNHYGAPSGSGTSTTTVLSVPYHKTVEMVERELSLNDFTGAFRQPIDLISRSDDHSHELCSEGNLVDLSLRSSFGQDQTASSFLRELIDLSSRSDSFHGEINLTNKQQHPQQASAAHSQPQPQLHHHHSHSSTGQQHPPPKSGNPGPGLSHHNHHGSHHHGNPHHHHHHLQAPSHHQSNSSSSGGHGSVALQNVIYPDAIFSLQN